MGLQQLLSSIKSTVNFTPSLAPLVGRFYLGAVPAMSAAEASAPFGCVQVLPVGSVDNTYDGPLQDHHFLQLSVWASTATLALSLCEALGEVFSGATLMTLPDNEPVTTHSFRATPVTVARDTPAGARSDPVYQAVVRMEMWVACG